MGESDYNISQWHVDIYYESLQAFTTYDSFGTQLTVYPNPLLSLWVHMADVHSSCIFHDRLHQFFNSFYMAAKSSSPEVHSEWLTYFHW